MAVQRTPHPIPFNRQKPVASNSQHIYTHAHNGWMSLAGVDCSLPHNPSVTGSSPVCPIFLSGYFSSC